MQQSAEPVPSAHLRWNAVREWGDLTRGVGSNESERSVRTLAVVVVDVGVEHPLELAAPDDQQPVEALVSAVRTQRSANALAFGARIGVLTMSAPSVRKTSSNAALNFESRS